MLLRVLALLAALVLAAPTHATRIFRPPPLISTAAGAEPIELRRLSISADVEGGMAKTTVRMVFFNPNRRQLEGNLQFPLLDGQQVSAFALDIEGNMRAAVPVGKAHGQAVFDAIERRSVDPALLETTQGNNFKLRIYPIPAGGTRTVELSYIEALARKGKQWAYRLPLAYGKVADFDLDIRVGDSTGAPPAVRGAIADLRFERSAGDYRATTTRSRLTLDDTLDIAFDASEQPTVYRQTLDGASYFVAEIKVDASPSRRPPPKTIGLLWDSSGSGASRAHDAEFAVLDRYFQALGKVEVRLIRLRDRAEAPQVYQVRNGEWSLLRRALEATVYDGASALDDWKAQAEVDQYLLFSDGLLNYGAAQAPRLAPRQSLFALNAAVSGDGARLSALAEANRGESIAVDPQRPDDAVHTLLYQSAAIDAIESRGAAEVVARSRNSRDGMLRVAGRLLPTQDRQLVLTISGAGGPQRLSVPLDAIAHERPFAATLWAGWRLRQLDADFELHRAEIGRIGRAFRIPTRETSLIVLDRLDDYVRNDIEPPPELKAAYDKLKTVRMQSTAQLRSRHFDTVLRQFEQRIDWWNTSFPRPPVKFDYSAQDRNFDARSSSFEAMPPPPPAPMAAPAKSAGPAQTLTVQARRSRFDVFAASVAQPQPAIGMALKKWTADAPYIERLRKAPAESVYALYLDEKPGYSNSSAFFLDAADILFDKGQRELALRVLSNLAEMDLENRAVLRILGYRLLQAGVPALAVPVFEKVLRLAPEEPQSFRDLGLAQAAAGQPQAAIDNLYEVVLRPWDFRFPEIETIAITEINAIVAASPAGTKLDTSRIDPRLLRNLPLDLRVVMSWDADNADMDLWVTDPSGQLCNFAHNLTAQGGKMSRDFTGGYGPEEFSLRRARPGKYRIEANYYGNRQQVLAGATTLQVKLFTGFGTARQKEQVITLRLKDRGETVYVGEFEIAR